MDNQQQIRTFIAIEISDEVREALGSLIAEMEQSSGNVKWVKPSSIHLTLKFLGNITESQVEQVTASVRASADSAGKFSLFTGEKGAFPSLNRPRVFWVGLNEKGNSKLLPLQKRIENELEKIGFAAERRRFSPHLTIGRVRTPQNIEAVSEKFMAYPLPEREFSVNRIVIMKSDLTPRGAIYTVQRTIELSDDE
ncbi:MAG: RNA 2',3'-cyclic phosphodiesterase [Calditrichia bacterium]